VFAVLAFLGGLVQINPVWLYGPFEPQQVSSPAQPDWYLGWVDGALRVFPPWELRAFGFELPNPFFPAVLMPGITFALLYAWPFLEARYSKDREVHHLLDRPRDHPLRTALGAATLAFYTAMFFAASIDLLAKWLRVSVHTMLFIFQVLVIVSPIVAGWVTYRLMKALQASGADRFGHMPLSALRSAREASKGS
jgi:ubiquinol-cytochrome c reductase cytochrome b subunit